MQLVDAGLPRPAGGLVAGRHHRAQAEGVVQGLQWQHRRHRGAVGVGDDAPRRPGVQLVGVDLGDDEGDVGVHAEGGGVVDDQRPGGDGAGRVLLGPVTSGAEQRDVDPIEDVLVGQVPNRDVAVPPADRAAGRTGGRQQDQVIQREVPAVQQPPQVLTDCAGGTGDRNSSAHG